MLTAEQSQKLRAVLAKEHLGVLITQGDEWATGTMQAFAETNACEIIFVMASNAEKYENAMKRPRVTVMVDTRDQGIAPDTFQIARASMQGLASDVAPGSAEWEQLKAIFLAKNPFEAPFFGNPALRMIRIKPQRVSYASGLQDSFKAEF
jgi:general stress protein 26